MSVSVEIPILSTHREQSDALDKRADSIVSVLLNHLSQQAPAHMPTLESVAESLNLSPGYLRHIIKQQTGTSFSRHIKTLRMRRARQLLQETCWTVKQVMIEVGISDHSHFAKDYKKEFGESPTQTRCKALAVRKKIVPCVQRNSTIGYTQKCAPHARQDNPTTRCTSLKNTPPQIS